MTGTHASDLNELACLYFLNKETWLHPDDEALFREKAGLVKTGVSKESVTVQVERGRAQAQALRIYAIEQGYRIGRALWVSRIGCLQSYIPWASVGHPADILLELYGVPGAVDYLGVSLKSRKSKEDTVGLRNPGLGTLEDALSVPLVPIVDKAVEFAIETYGLPESQDARKKALRGAGEVRTQTTALGSLVLSDVREAILDATVAMSNDELRSIIQNTLMDMDVRTTPKYVRVVGTGNLVTGFKAEVHDPFAVTLPEPITVQRVGTDSIGFLANGGRVCLLRAKWESEKLASSLKFSVDPWR